jgi:hypothetical protein
LSGKRVVLAILALGAALATLKAGQEVLVWRHVRERAAALARELAGLDRPSLEAGDHRKLRELLSKGGHYAEFDHYRDRAVPVLEERFRKDGEPGRRAAWLLILLKINSPRSREFFLQALPTLSEPDLRREVEEYLARLPPGR